MEISKIKLTQIEPADYNPRTITEDAKKKLRNSIETFGLVEPIIINVNNNRIVSGHQRYDILLDMLMESDNLAEREFDYLVKDDYGYIFDFNQLQIKNEDYEKALNIVLNNTNLMGDYDYQKLEGLLTELEFNGFNLEFTGFDDFEVDSLNFGSDFEYGIDDNSNIDERIGELVSKYDDDEKANGVLIKKYLVPPFSVLNTNMGYWDIRKKYWQDLIQDNAETREKVQGKLGTSLLDSTLAEVIIHWFTPYFDSNNVFDVFAGDTVFGYIASYKGNTFTGIELREEQVELNNERVKPLNPNSHYYTDDGQNVLNHIEENSQDLFFSCPPYFDLEVYSDLPNDASNQNNYEDFLNIIRIALTNGAKCLKENRFAVIVVGDIRDKNGAYYGFPSDIIQIMKDAGLHYYNELILYNRIGSARIRADQSFKNRKIIKIHQNVLVFYKGDLSKIQEEFPAIEMEEE